MREPERIKRAVGFGKDRRAQVGGRLYGVAPLKKGAQTLSADLTQNALIALWVNTGATNGEAFDACIETQRAPVPTGHRHHSRQPVHAPHRF